MSPREERVVTRQLRIQCRPSNKIVVTGPAMLRLSRRVIVIVSARDRENIRIE